MRTHVITVTATLLGALLVQSCASPESILGKDPIVDMAGVDPQDYNIDLTECRAYADQVQTGRQVLTSTVTGAAVGGVVGAVAGNASTARRSAGIGGVMGVLSGGSSAMTERQRVVRNCLIGRGYQVLN